jgi:hypothetical protein
VTRLLRAVAMGALTFAIAARADTEHSAVRISAPSVADYGMLWAQSDPTNPANLLVCGMMQDQPDNITAGYAFASHDSGKTWRRTFLDDTTRWVSEDSCAFAPNGRAFFADGASRYVDGIPHHEYGHLRVFESREVGDAWTKQWVRAQGWVDWTYLGFTSATSPRLIVFGNEATDRIGHNWPRRPVALIAENTDATQFSGPYAPPPRKMRVTTAWTGGSVMLRDGSALFASTTSATTAQPKRQTVWWLQRLNTEFFSVGMNGRIRSRAMIPLAPGWTAFLVSLALDDSNGLYHGRLYATWAESNGRSSAIRLATSDDDGFHWSSRVLLRAVNGYCVSTGSFSAYLSNPKVAVNSAGVVGLTWIEDARVLRAATSIDGGRTFSGATTVATAADLDQNSALGETVPFDEYSLAEGLAAARHKPFENYVELSALGLSIRLLRDASLEDSGITAGSDNDFDVFWSGPEWGGGHGLWMRTLRENSGGSHESIPLSGECSESANAPRAALPQVSIALPASLGRDISRSFGFDPRHTSFQRPTHTVTVTLVFHDYRKKVASANLLLIATHLHSDFGEPVAIDADGSIRGCPYWWFHSDTRRTTLIKLSFNVRDFHDTLRLGDEGDLVAMRLRIYPHT